MLSRAAAAGLAGLGLALLLSWLAALAMNHDVLPGTDVRLAALVCCGLACLAAGALSPRPEQGRALGGAMTWAVWAIGYVQSVSVITPALRHLVKKGSGFEMAAVLLISTHWLISLP